MTADINEDLLLYAFSLMSLVSQTYFLAWMGDKLSDTVKTI